MKVLLKKISDSGIQYKDGLTLETLSNNGDKLKFLKPIAFEGELKKSEDFVEVNGEISIRYIVLCHSCGKEFEKEDKFKVFEVYRREPTEDEYLLTGDEIELDEMIIDNLRLQLPVRYLCSEGCKGICTICGKDLNLEECSCKKDEKESPFDVLKKML